MCVFRLTCLLAYRQFQDYGTGNASCLANMHIPGAAFPIPRNPGPHNLWRRHSRSSRNMCFLALLIGTLPVDGGSSPGSPNAAHVSSRQSPLCGDTRVTHVLCRSQHRPAGADTSARCSSPETNDLSSCLLQETQTWLFAAAAALLLYPAPKGSKPSSWFQTRVTVPHPKRKLSVLSSPHHSFSTAAVLYTWQGHRLILMCLSRTCF